MSNILLLLPPDHSLVQHPPSLASIAPESTHAAPPNSSGRPLPDTPPPFPLFPVPPMQLQRHTHDRRGGDGSHVRLHLLAAGVQDHR